MEPSKRYGAHQKYQMPRITLTSQLDREWSPVNATELIKSTKCQRWHLLIPSVTILWLKSIQTIKRFLEHYKSSSCFLRNSKVVYLIAGEHKHRAVSNRKLLILTWNYLRHPMRRGLTPSYAESRIKYVGNDVAKWSVRQWGSRIQSNFSHSSPAGQQGSLFNVLML